MVRVAIIGMGYIGRLHAKWSEKIDNCQLVAICDGREEVCKEYSEKGLDTYSDYKELLKRDDIDAVYICTPLPSHFEIAMAAIAADKHILCEKPLVMNPQQAADLRAAARKSTKKFQVDFIERYCLSAQEAKWAIDNGEVGEINYIRGNFRWYMKRHLEMHGPWVFDRSVGGGILLEASPHIFDIVRYWSGKEVIDVCCCVHEHEVQGLTVEDNMACIMNLEGGGIACIDLSGGMPMGSPTDKRFEILGDKGNIYIDEYNNYIQINSEVGHEFNPNDVGTGLTKPDVLWHGMVESGCWRSQRDFIDCIEKDLEPLSTLEDGARACELTWAAFKSLETKKFETVQYGS